MVDDRDPSLKPPPSFTHPGSWRGQLKLPKGSRRKPQEVVQCESRAGKVRCHDYRGHLDDGDTVHWAQGVLTDEWVHRWEWDTRGRITKTRWIQETIQFPAGDC
jgi:YD repeat-containing protein